MQSNQFARIVVRLKNKLNRIHLHNLLQPFQLMLVFVLKTMGQNKFINLIQFLKMHQKMLHYRIQYLHRNKSILRKIQKLRLII